MSVPTADHRDSTELPRHARLVANAEVWMEGDAVLQLAKAAALPGCVAAVGMPDLHVGKGPVGAVFATRGCVYPHLLGGDVGCGVTMIATREKAKSRDALERRLEATWGVDPLDGARTGELLRRVWSRGVRALTEEGAWPDSLRQLAAGLCEKLPRSEQGDDRAALEELVEPGAAVALGSIGGGNHFAEIARVDQIVDRAAASTLGLERGAMVVLAHSGSRGLGSALARSWGNATLESTERIAAYLRQVDGVRRYAEVNRLVLAYRLLVALGATRPSKVTGSVSVTHNDVREEQVRAQPAWVHRKGAAPAHAGSPTIVLGSRGAVSWVMLGTGAETGLSSVAHGAGRRMGRAEARSKIREKYRRSELRTTELGGRVICDEADLLYEEHPDAYKPVEPVVASLVEAGLATRVASLVPVMTVKR
jgi:release factor H-coupled RctB family protein